MLPAGSGGAAGAICLMPGCGKPTWNGQSGEYCGRACKAAAVPAGALPGPGAALCLPCTGGAAVAQAAVCSTPGCGKPTWNGQPNEYCGRACKAAAATGAPATAAPVCLKPGCGKPTWNGLPNEYCGKACRDQMAPPKPKPAFGSQVDQAKFQELEQQFVSKWKAGSSPPQIKSIWYVQDDNLAQRHLAYCQSIGNVKVRGSGQNPGNQQRRFHATKLGCSFNGTPCSNSGCYVCSIIKTGFKSSKAGTSAGSCYGAGIYCSATSSKAYAYGKQAMFVVGVACGVADISGSSGSLPSGTHSRIVNNSNDECVVFHDDAIIPKYLILF